MAFKRSDLSRKMAPEKREEFKQDELKELSEMEVQQRKENVVQEFSRRLKAHGVSDEAVEAAVAKMKAAGEGHE